MKFGPKLKRLLRKHRFSQKQMAILLGVSQNLVSLWTRGKLLPGLREAKALAEALEVSIDYLADDARDEPAAGDWDRKLKDLVDLIGPEAACRRIVEDPKIRRLPDQPPRLADEEGASRPG